MSDKKKTIVLEQVVSPHGTNRIENADNHQVRMIAGDETYVIGFYSDGGIYVRKRSDVATEQISINTHSTNQVIIK
jgi:hypothetical protein